MAARHLANKSKVFLLLGQCLPSLKTNASRIRVRRMVLDTNLNMYFREDKIFWVHDPEKICKSGDVVLIKELPEKLTKLITHSIEEIVFPLGDVTDPITGKKCVVGKYRDQIEEANKLFGKSPNAFDYEKAPKRGSQEGKRDFSHGPVYIKYQDDGSDQPFAH